ncbi:hypothetical protein HLB44_03370 [Aquincola sp. S2]|uniref:Right handed beta helix domain-containing protein n=1 Tax=Pseudaquabacterium terrae TaxID=2732868 RepID=A0ABX2EAY1_9BURK|nr:hypothetical protein [Aquabacterium terrae]NRF66023.1 hypothetical protein [Aquabacterium terrae]
MRPTILHFCLLAAASTLAPPPVWAAGCDDAAFVDAIAEAAWINLDVTPAQGTAGVRAALQQAQAAHPNQPVRIRLAPGAYADNIGHEIYAQRLLRGAASPIWLKASDTRPNATRLGHGINLLGVSYIAIDGVTIGPERVGAWNGQAHADPQPLQAAAGIHVAGAALNARTNAAGNGPLNYAVYGRYEPSHHILVRRVTVQNLFDPQERDGETSESLSMDGMKFNQVQDLWVLDSQVSQTTRHGIDMVGVHRAAICRSLIAQSGGGLGIEAKGGSIDVLYDSNTFYRVRRVELGGEDTDATYYYSADGRWDYEALRTIARNNLIVDAREAALEFSGCQDCAAVGNTIVFTAGYQPPSDGGTIFGGDAMRLHDSRILGAADGAGSDCQFWDAAQQDYVTVDPCWGVGANAPAPVNRVLRSNNLLVANNVFAAVGGSFGRGTGGVVPCPLNVTGGTAMRTHNANYWWNGGSMLPSEGCSALNEGPRSRWPGAGATLSPIAGSSIDSTSLGRLGGSIVAALLPRSGAPLADMAIAAAQQAAHDRLGAPRGLVGGASVGAIVGVEPTSDRLFNFAERFYPEYFPTHAASGHAIGYYYRHHAATDTYIGSKDGRLYVLGPAFGGQITDLGPLANWLPAAQEAGF